MPSTRPEDLESRVPLLMGVLIGMGATSTIAVALRFLARGFISRNIGVDDWMMLVAMVFSILTSITGSLSAHYGMGRHIVSLESYQITMGIKMVWFARMFSQTAFGFVKLSIALLYLRIFSISKIFTNFLYGTIAFNFIVTTIWLVMTIKCIPVSANWNLDEVPTAKCIVDHVTVEYAFFAGVAHSLLDVIYVVLPLIFVWNLRLPSRQKFGLMILLSLGLFAAICSMIKISKTSQLGKTKDITWEFTELSIWNVAELNVGIIVGSIPPMRPLLSFVYRNTSDAIGITSLSRSRQNKTNMTPGPSSRTGNLARKDSGTFELVNRSHAETRMYDYDTKTVEGKGTSEESILKPQGREIVQTREVEVSSEYEPDQYEQEIGLARSGDSHPVKKSSRK